MVMKFKVSYGGTANKSGLLGMGVQKYEAPSVKERIQNIKQGFFAKKATIRKRAEEAKPIIKARFSERAAARTSGAINARVTSNKGSFVKDIPYYAQNQGNDKSIYFSTGNQGYYMGANDNTRNIYFGNSINTAKKEKEKNIRIIIPK